MGLDRLTTSGRRMFARVTVPTSGRKIEIYLAAARNFLVRGLSSTLVESIIFRPEDSVLPGWEKFLTSGRRIEFFLGKFQLSGPRIEIYLAEPGSYLLERLSSKLVDTIIFRPEDLMLPAWEKFSTSGRRMEFLIPNFQLSGRRIGIYVTEPGSFLLERHSSILVETNISRPEVKIISGLEKFSISGCRMMHFFVKIFQLPARGFVDSQLLVGRYG